YQGQYPLFGDAQVMPLKVIWDYTYYWSLLAPLYFAGRIADLPLLSRMKPDFLRARDLNLAMQSLLADWGRRNRDRAATDGAGRLLDQHLIDWFHELNRALHDALDDAAFAARIHGNVQRMAALARELLAQARHHHPDLPDHGLEALTPAAAASPPALAERWYRTG
ncbi:halogenase, partial [Xanthomonas sp. Kuri4-1]